MYEPISANTGLTIRVLVAVSKVMKDGKLDKITRLQAGSTVGIDCFEPTWNCAGIMISWLQLYGLAKTPT